MINDGKYLEKAVEQYFDELKRVDVNYMRNRDSKSARNLISAQPADFWVATSAAGASLLECKSKSSKPNKNGMYSFTNKFNQYPLMLRWFRAGVPGYILVHWTAGDKLMVVGIHDLILGITSFAPKLNYSQLNIALGELLNAKKN